MTSPLLLSLTHHKLHAHTPDLTSTSIPRSTPTAITASDTYIAEGSQSGSLILRDPFTLQPVHTLPSHTSCVTALVISSSHLAAGHTDGTVSLHNLSSHDHTSFTESSSIISLAYPATARYLAAATTSAVALFSTVSNRLITRLTQPATRSYPRIATAQARFTAVAFSPIHASLLAATDDTGCLTVYDISAVLSSSRTHPVRATPTSSTSQSKFPSALKAPSTDLSFAPDGHLAVVGFDKLVRVFNPSLKQLLFTVALPSPISAVCYGPLIAVGLTDASIATVRVDLQASSGNVVKRISIDVGAGVGGSRAVKRVLFQPKPKRRKPPRSTTPLYVSSQEVKEEVLADVNDLIDGKHVGKSAMRDDDLFSPVRDGTTQIRHLAGKSASFHTSPAEREVSAAAPRSRSVHSITTQAHASEDEQRSQETSGDQGLASSKDAKWDDMFDEDVDDDDIISTTVVEDSFEGVTRRRSLDNANVNTNTSANDIERREQKILFTRDDSDVKTSRPYTRTSSSVETRSHSREDWGTGKIVKSMSDMQMTPPLRRLKQKEAAEESRGRTVRFEHLQDVMLGQPVLEMQMTKDQDKPRTSTHEHAQKSHEDYEARQRTVGKGSLAERHMATHIRDATVSESASAVKDFALASQPGLTADSIRDIVKQEIDVMRTDLRSDILNIHAELITLATRHSQEIATALTERDGTIRRLEEEVRRLDADNMRLRRKYGIG